MAALDHWLNVLDIALKHGERKQAEKAAARDERKQTRTQKAFGGGGGDSPGVAVPKDPSCCLANRKFSK